ncbi:MAG: hypothetical protein EPN14_08060 [Gallionella sp.]|nr:MAG: hypothetical protein EPN14_08060 [Gallionella sp.]
MIRGVEALSRLRRAVFQSVPRSGVQLSVLCLLFSAFCHAEELPDPTRLPAIIGAPAAAAQAEMPGLQSIIISKARRAAIIDGETVELGGRHGDAKLVGVNEGSVVLQGAQGRQVLALFPGVKITQKKNKAKPPPPASKAQAGKRKAGQAVHKERK